MLSVWVPILLLALAALLPVAAALFAPARVRGRAEADLALYRAQRAELAREHAAGRLDAAGLEAATLEVQRRLLAAPVEAPREGRLGRRVLAATLLAVPLLAGGLYWWNGIPEMPSAGFAVRQAEGAREEAMIASVRARLAQLPAGDPRAREGWLLIGNAERGRGALGPAAEAYRRALALGFEPDAASQLAQVLLEDGQTEAAVTLLAQALPRAPQHIGLRFLSGLAEERAGRPANARRIWQALLADAPDGMPWKAMVERRLSALP
jgi:cytochrome c-type biogenesis protein CcmH